MYCWSSGLCVRLWCRAVRFEPRSLNVLSSLFFRKINWMYHCPLYQVRVKRTVYLEIKQGSNQILACHEAPIKPGTTSWIWKRSWVNHKREADNSLQLQSQLLQNVLFECSSSYFFFFGWESKVTTAMGLHFSGMNNVSIVKYRSILHQSSTTHVWLLIQFCSLDFLCWDSKAFESHIHATNQVIFA